MKFLWRLRCRAVAIAFYEGAIRCDLRDNHNGIHRHDFGFHDIAWSEVTPTWVEPKEFEDGDPKNYRR